MTARLSRKLYDILGEDVAQELVDWFNLVDATYGGDLRELNELNFARFDAKLEQRITELDAKFELRFGELESRLERRIGDLDAKFERQLTSLESRLDRRIDGLDAKLGQHVVALNASIDQGFARSGVRFATFAKDLQKTRADLIKWMFLFWAGSALAVVGLTTRLL